ncbi:MAG TPA: hypothetical protein VNR41_02225 [Xanthobacteraceae bacterium]|jgi:hypothetical protein|nr:hypothetical protein [Xanthobacteraceae bacterium]
MSQSGKRPESSRDDRRARALRENLKRRKAQARGRAEGEKGEADAEKPRDSGPADRQNRFSHKD